MREFMSFMRNNNMLVNDIAILNISFIWLFRLPSLQLPCKNLSHLAADMCKYIGYIVFNKFDLYKHVPGKYEKPINIFK